MHPPPVEAEAVGGGDAIETTAIVAASSASAVSTTGIAVDVVQSRHGVASTR